MHLHAVWIFYSLFVILGCIQLVQLEDSPPPEIVVTETEVSPRARNQIKKMWTVESAEINEIEITHYELFKSSNDYVIHTELITYYWVGKDTPKGEAGEAASHAVVVSFKTHFKVKVQREAEGQESPAFKALFKNDEADGPGSGTNSPTEKIGVNINVEKMFIIEEKHKNVLSLKEVGLSMYHVIGRKSTCAVFVLKKVLIFCQKNTTPKQRKGAEALARIMLEMRGHGSENFEHVTRDDSPYFTGLNNSITSEITIRLNEFTPAELRKILDQTQIMEDGKEWFFMQVYRVFYENSDGTVNYKPLLENTRKRSFLSSFHPPNDDMILSLAKTNECYIIDSESNAGLLVWFGSNSNIFLLKGTAKRMEILLKQSPMYNYATPITFLNQSDKPAGLKSMQQLLQHIIFEKERSTHVERIHLRLTNQ